LALAFAAAMSLAAGVAEAAPVSPRFVILVDSSGSMVENASRVETHGDGSVLHPGCDLDGNGRYDDSKLFQAKAALIETLTAFGSAEFALARYDQEDLGQPCATTQECVARSGGLSNLCIDGRCAFRIPGQHPDYDECTGGSATGNGCIRCAAPANDPTHIHVSAPACCGAGSATAGGFGVAGDVMVGFSSGGATNVPQLFSWMDGVETFPAGSNMELRGVGVTPIGAALNGLRDWLTNDASMVGPGAGILNRDPKVDCRSYNVILITDGLETGDCTRNCGGITGSLAAELLAKSCTNGGIWDFVDRRCERGGNPEGTRSINVRTYVVGFTVNDASLNGIAAAGGTGTAVLANNQAELTARLGDIIARSIPFERCDCQDNTCDGIADETFPRKGQACTVGVGRCKRAGTFGCSANGTELVCSAAPAGACPAAALSPGTPGDEVCGNLAGCLAPTALDCADEDCDGLVDENLACTCSAKPETCNGKDDDCNGAIDDVPETPCGLSIGQCQAGIIVCADDGLGGKRAECRGGTPPATELCDGLDNDCDGVTDGFGLSCYPAATGGCRLDVTPLACGGTNATPWTCAGICQTGVLTCDQGTCGECLGAVTPRTEVACDGLDNDCDGATDEDFGVGGACGAEARGECRSGVLSCVGNGLRCVGGRGPSPEICNGKDDDCDGTTDNIPGACGISEGACAVGRWRCKGIEPFCDMMVGPQPESCDGLDNDCNGLTDDGLVDPDLVTATPCGTDEGICQRGVLKCLGGRKVCDGAVEARFERCNGVDDDCDGATDENVGSPGACPPDGVPANAPVLGECRPGFNVCTPDGQGGAAYQCKGGVGPAAEICDGKDNDCDGTIDDQAPCPAGFACAYGECAPVCAGGEFACPTNRLCQDGVCVFAECVRTPCPAGFGCDSARGCYDRCTEVVCERGLVCQGGACTTCRNTGCPPGNVCRVAECEPDTCRNVTCEGSSYCRNGTCAASCTGVRCPGGQTCVDGACAIDLCRGVQCDFDEFCQPASGTCLRDPCRTIRCLPGQACIPARATCEADPCVLTACKGEDQCVVFADGRAACVAAEDAPANQPLGRVAVSGEGGCACALGRTRSSPFGAFTLMCLAAILVGARRRVRR
jgi:hypothetical protein